MYQGKRAGDTASLALQGIQGCILLCGFLWRGSSKGVLALSVAYFARLGPHHHAAQVWLWERVNLVKVKVPQQNSPNGLDLHRLPPLSLLVRWAKKETSALGFALTTTSRKLPHKASRRSASGRGVKGTSNASPILGKQNLISYFKLCSFAGAENRCRPAGTQNWCPCSRACHLQTLHN